ncbi:MAG: ABC transporter substrate-binding protein [Bacillota bacterium]
MTIRRRAAALLSAVLVTAVALTGCGGKQEAPKTETPASTPAASGPVTIEFWHAFGGKAGEATEALVKKYNESQKDVIVKSTYQGDYYSNHQKMSAAIAAKNAPAVSVVEVASISFFADNGALADIGALAGNDAQLKDFLPGLMKESQWGGKTISVPYGRSTPILYLNKKLLTEAGLDPNGPKTWEELRDYAKKLVKRDASGKVERWGFLTPVDIWFYEALVYQAGGTFFTPDNKKAAFNDKAGQDALNFWVSLIHEDKVMEMPQGEKYNAWDVSTNAFTNGQAAMIFSTTGRLTTHITGAKDFEVGTAFLPAGSKGFGTPTGGANLVILSSVSKEQQAAAWKFVKWMTAPEQSAELAKATGYMPTSNGAVKLMDETFKKYPQFETAVKQLQYAQSRPQHPGYAQAQETVMKALQKAVLKQATVQQALDEAAAEVTKQLK